MVDEGLDKVCPFPVPFSASLSISVFVSISVSFHCSGLIIHFLVALPRYRVKGAPAASSSGIAAAHCHRIQTCRLVGYPMALAWRPDVWLSLRVSHAENLVGRRQKLADRPEAARRDSRALLLPTLTGIFSAGYWRRAIACFGGDE
ncbi:unnamed protein product [Phaeothamnion confervicola]